MASTMTVETVKVVRPLKVIAFICGVIACTLCIVCISPSEWIRAKQFQQGLWKTCRYNIDNVMTCFSNPPTSWLQACGALTIISLLVAVVATAFNGVGVFCMSKPETRKKFYRGAAASMFFALLCQVIALIVFPIMFMQNLENKSESEKITEWYFAWAYGIGWGAAIFQLGAAILLIIDKEEDELYYNEKTKYDDNYYNTRA